ncbi:MAG: DsrE family protein [Nitrospirae bacterium]|nr:DsrE family protein [Nitrospirota bacterium]
MDNLLVILRKPPYGVINAAEAVRHAGGAGGFDYKVILYLIDSGVYTAKKNQDAGNTGFTGLGESLELLSEEMEIYVNKDSLTEYNLKEEDLIEGVKIDSVGILKQSISAAQSIMIF